MARSDTPVQQLVYQSCEIKDIDVRITNNTLTIRGELRFIGITLEIPEA
jgi:hypothetical protein